jgi:hypothetical protein
MFSKLSVNVILPRNLELVYLKKKSRNFHVFLTVHLSIFILVINQLDAQNLFYDEFISCLYMFRAPCAHRQEVKIVLYSLWYPHTL